VNSTAAAPKIARSQILSLAEAGISEHYLERMIAEDASGLGLGDDVVLVERQRRQERAGRLDLLLEDRENEVRFEVELMLGSLDESHLVRAIEYWDIERRRYPAYDHRCVIVAESITNRFLNVIQLFSGSIPLIAIQANAVRVGDTTTISLIRLIDSTELRLDDTSEVSVKGADRSYWASKIDQSILSIVDECAAVINEAALQKRSLNYNRQYIGLAAGSTANNFVYFKPRKTFVGLRIRIEEPDAWQKKVEAAGLDAAIGKGRRLKVDISPETFRQQKALIAELLKAAVREDEA
jgi:hypothetical protein